MANGIFGNIDPNMMLALSGGLLSGGTAPQQVGNAFTNAAQYRIGAQEKNKTLEYLRRANPELAAQVEAGMPVGTAWQQLLQSRQPKKPNFLTVGKTLYNADTGEWITPPGGAEASDEWGLNPVWGTDTDGRTVLGQVSKTGKFKPLDTGDFTPTPGISNIDAGTQVITRNNRTGQVITTTPKDLAGAERQKAGGKAEGELDAAAPGAIQKADQMVNLLDAMLAHPGREAATGLSSVLDPRNYLAGTDATDFNTRRKQIEGQAFLQAFESLKGGGQITEVEGRKATEAIARLETAQSDEAYAESLSELRDIALQAKARAQTRMGGQQMPGTQQNGINQTTTGRQWRVVE